MIVNNQIEFILNGKNVSIEARPGEMLAELLRERFNLTGTKISCNEAECGACTVILDKEPVLSCSYPAQRVHGREVITIEGLENMSPPLGLHPLQEAFVKYGAVQCGFCIPGMLMTAYGLLLSNNDPTSEEIRYAFKDSLCRCAGYPSIERAITAAAKSMRENKPVEAFDLPGSVRAQNVVGTLQPRPEADAKVRGKAVFTDDLKFEGMLYGQAKRAGIPHGRLIRLNTQKAETVPGVRAVLTAKDIPGNHNHGLVIPDWPSIVDIGEDVQYVGDTVALVAADTHEIAQKAVSLIEAEYENLPVITDPVQARQPDAVNIHKNGNLLKHIKVRKGDVTNGFEKADIILEHTFRTSMTDHLFMEPECSVARLTPDGRMEISVGSQIPYSDRSQVAAALGWPEEKVHIKGMLIGGGFGGKEDITGQIHAALLALATKKPVKILYDRKESLIVHPKRHATQIRVKMGAQKDGHLVSVQTELYGDTGAYASLGEKVMTRATTHSSGPYEIENVSADCFAMYTNNPPAGAFRGFGVLQSAFAIESMMDMLSEKNGC